MRRFRLYWGGMRSNNSVEWLLDWASRCLPDHHVNLFDGDEYICTIRIGAPGTTPTYFVNDDEITYTDVLSMTVGVIVE